MNFCTIDHCGKLKTRLFFIDDLFSTSEAARSTWNILRDIQFITAATMKNSPHNELSPLRCRGHPLEAFFTPLPAISRKNSAKVLVLFLSGSLFYLNPASSFVKIPIRDGRLLDWQIV